MLCPTKCCDNLLRAADTTNSWKDMRADIVMFFFRERVHRIFGEHLVVAMLVGLAGRGINAKAGGNATQDNGVNPPTAQLEIEIRAKEGAPLMLRDQVIQGLQTQFRRKLGPVFGTFSWQREPSIADRCNMSL